MLRIKWVPVHFVKSVSGRVSVSEFDKCVSMRARLYKVDSTNGRGAYPLLFPV
jgi:hypothetical protein